MHWIHSKHSCTKYEFNAKIISLIQLCKEFWEELTANSKSKLCYDRRSVGQFILDSSPHLWPKTRYLLLLDSFWFVYVRRPFSREDRSVVYNCCWSSPAQSFSGPIRAGIITTFYCLRFETPPTWRVKSPYLYSPGTGWTGYTPRHWVPFSSSTTRRATVFQPYLLSLHTKYFIQYEMHRNYRIQQFSYCSECICSRGNISAAPLPINGCLFCFHCFGLQTLRGGHTERKAFL
jgi:hypothetical protein